MSRLLDPFRFVLIALSGWMNYRESQLIEYLQEENRVLREQLGDKRLRFTDEGARSVVLPVPVTRPRLPRLHFRTVRRRGSVG